MSTKESDVKINKTAILNKTGAFQSCPTVFVKFARPSACNPGNLALLYQIHVGLTNEFIHQLYFLYIQLQLSLK